MQEKLKGVKNGGELPFIVQNFGEALPSSNQLDFQDGQLLNSGEEWHEEIVLSDQGILEPVRIRVTKYPLNEALGLILNLYRPQSADGSQHDLHFYASRDGGVIRSNENLDYDRFFKVSLKLDGGLLVIGVVDMGEDKL